MFHNRRMLGAVRRPFAAAGGTAPDVTFTGQLSGWWDASDGLASGGTIATNKAPANTFGTGISGNLTNINNGGLGLGVSIGTIGSKPGFVFDRTKHGGLYSGGGPGSNTLFDTGSTAPTDCAFFMIMKTPLTGDAFAGIHGYLRIDGTNTGAGIGPNNYLCYEYPPSTILRTQANSQVADFSSLVANTVYRCLAVRSSGVWTWYINNIAQTPALTDGGAQLSALITISWGNSPATASGGNYWDGTIGEMGFIWGAVSSGQRSAHDAYLAAKYA